MLKTSATTSAIVSLCVTEILQNPLQMLEQAGHQLLLKRGITAANLPKYLHKVSILVCENVSQQT